MDTPAGWYPDPELPGGQRYFDGRSWTNHRNPPPGPWPPPHWPPPGAVAWAGPPWKGSGLGRPAGGPGALAEPGRRLGARLLDHVVLIPVLAVVAGVTIAIVAPHAGPIFPVANTNSDRRPPTPGIVWIYLAFLGAVIATAVLAVVYETVSIARFGRTLGMRWLHIRPLRTDGGPLGWGRAFARTVIYWVSAVVGWLGLINPLWCLWDENRQCLHDKAADTIVVND
jgi:uncharacterized RDD family membrane protein YckC